MRAIIYTRVSSDQTGEFRSVESQEAECRAVCARKGWEVVDVLRDNDLGASRWSAKSRPEYKKLADMLGSDDVQVLVTWEASRAQRDLAAYVALRDLCAERDVFWCYSGRTFDLSKGDDRFTTGLDALLAEREADMIRDRVLRGKKAAALKGLPGGRPAWGYKREFDPISGRTTGWIKDPEEEQIVTEVFTRVLAGESVWAIVRDFENRGIESPKLQKNARKEWNPQSLRRTISSPSYAGWRTHQGKPVIDDKGQRVKGNWPPYITPEQHERILAIFSDPARRVTSHRGVEPKWLLSGVIKCGVCGEGMRYFNPPSNPGPSARYRCGGRKMCTSRRADAVELLVTETVLNRLERPDAATLFSKSGDADITKALEKADTLRKRLAAFVESAANGEVSPGALAAIEKRLRPQIEEAETKARAEIATPLVGKLMGPDTRDKWEQFSLIEKRTVIRTLLFVKVNKAKFGNNYRFDSRDIEIEWLVGDDI